MFFCQVLFPRSSILSWYKIDLVNEEEELFALLGDMFFSLEVAAPLWISRVEHLYDNVRCFDNFFQLFEVLTSTPRLSWTMLNLSRCYHQVLGLFDLIVGETLHSLLSVVGLLNLALNFGQDAL